MTAGLETSDGVKVGGFTPGEWTFSKRGQRVYGGTTNGRTIAQISFIPEFSANGYLIAAAPDLLEAPIEVSKRCGPLSKDGEVARAAIAKALGQ